MTYIYLLQIYDNWGLNRRTLIEAVVCLSDVGALNEICETMQTRAILTGMSYGENIVPASIMDEPIDWGRP